MDGSQSYLWCPNCNDSGKEDKNSNIPCERCEGRGITIDMDDLFGIGSYRKESEVSMNEHYRTEQQKVITEIIFELERIIKRNNENEVKESAEYYKSVFLKNRRRNIFSNIFFKKAERHSDIDTLKNILYQIKYD